MKKTNENLSINNLAVKFDVKACGIAKFNKAIEDGTLEAMVRSSADEYSAGDLAPQLAQLRRNISSYYCNAKKRAVVTTADANVDKMVDAFKAFLATLAAPKKVFYTYTKEELMKVDQDKVDDLKACLASWYSKNGYTRESVKESMRSLFDTVAAWDAVFNGVLEDRDMVTKRGKKAAEAKAPEVSEGLLAKLTSGKGANLSKAQVDELLKLLGK